MIRRIIPIAFMYSSKLSLVVIFHVPMNFSTIFLDDDVPCHSNNSSKLRLDSDVIE